MVKKNWLFFIFFLQSICICCQSTMVVDSTFDLDGIVINDAASDDEAIYALAVQSDGKIIASGTAVLFSSITGMVGYDFCTVRYNPNGSIDSSFGNLGVVITDVAGYYDGTNDVMVQPDGKILLTGQGQDSSGNIRICCIRYNSDGTYDNSFGNNGISMPYQGASTAQCISMQSNNKILLGGMVNPSSNSNFFVIRLNTDGSIDSTFGNSGAFEYAINSDECYVTSIAIQSNDKIVLSGRHLNTSNYNEFVVMRLDTSGFFDNSFGLGGFVSTDVGNGIPLEVRLNFFGDILVGGTSGAFGSNEFMCLVKYKNNGSLDTSFSNDGIVFTQVECSTSAFALTIRSGNKYLLGGLTIDCGSPYFPHFALAQFNNSGQLDTIFDADGKYSYQTVGAIGRTFATDPFGAVYFGGNGPGLTGSDYMVLKLKGKNNFVSIENELTNKFNIYPNPTDGIFTIESQDSKIEYIELIDIGGKTIRRIPNNSASKFIDISDLKDGVYIVKLSTSNRSSFGKIVKK